MEGYLNGFTIFKLFGFLRGSYIKGIQGAIQIKSVQNLQKKGSLGWVNKKTFTIFPPKQEKDQLRD